MSLITVAFYEDRYGPGDATQIAAFIDDVSSEVTDYVALFDNITDDPIDASAWDETTTPAAIQGVVARVVNRAIGNPYGITQEGLGDHQRSFGVGASGGMLGPKDRRIIRRAINRQGAVSVAAEGYLPLEPETFDENDLVL